MAPIEAFGTNNPLGYFLSDISPHPNLDASDICCPLVLTHGGCSCIFFWGGGQLYSSAGVRIKKKNIHILEGKYSLESTDPRKSEIRAPRQLTIALKLSYYLFIIAKLFKVKDGVA